MSARVVIVGFATLDYVLTTARPMAGPGTVLANTLPAAWPRAGGAALYAARPLREAGCAAWPIAWVGNDENGAAYKTACRGADVAADGIVEVEGGKTPCCILVYHDDGQYTCLLDLGVAPKPGLSVGQAELVAAADMVVVAAADPRLVTDVIARVTDDQRLAWIAKDDPACFPPSLCEALVRRADVIFCNAAERPLVEPYFAEAKPGVIVFETRGAEGVRLRTKRSDHAVDATPIDVDDATGAGDTFAGAVLASLLAKDASPIIAAKHGVDQARDFLLARRAGWKPVADGAAG